ncbi:MAG: DUF2017 family protein, partial [Arthrobacter sp.]|nr:DUF2017 family protein [Arthrobacter sp.]
MAKTFVPGSRGITGFLEEEERELLRKLFSDVISMLEPEALDSEDPLVALVGFDPHIAPPSDAALRRLAMDMGIGGVDHVGDRGAGQVEV